MRAAFADGSSLPLVPTLLRPLAPFALSGHPAVSVPLGLGRASAFSVGVQLVGARGTDHALLASTRAVLSLSDWRFQAPAPDPAICG